MDTAIVVLRFPVGAVIAVAATGELRPGVPTRVCGVTFVPAGFAFPVSAGVGFSAIPQNAAQ